MENIPGSETIGSLLAFYKQETRIFGWCPNCNEPFRLSEVKLTYGQEPPKDLMTRLKTERDRLMAKVKELESTIDDLEEEHSSELDALDEKWDDKVSNEVDRRLETQKRQIRKDAIARSRAGQLGKTLEKVVPMFPGFGHHLCDVRPIFDPVDFVIFDGYFQGEITDSTFVEFKTGGGRLTDIQESIRDTVTRKRVHFETRRLSRETLRMITNGKPSKLKTLVD